MRELFVVEGESAGRAVQHVVDVRAQVVLPMQGKPLNAWKAARIKVETHSLFRALIDEVGCGIAEDFDLQKCRFDRVILLFDPDADGIHCAVLMGWFFHRWMPDLIASGRVLTVMPPRGELTTESGKHQLYYSDSEANQIGSQWEAAGDSNVQKKPFRGLASMGSDALARTCVAAATRRCKVVRVQDIVASLAIFGARKE